MGGGHGPTAKSRVVGEQVLVATEAEVEKAVAASRLAGLAADALPSRAALSRSLRFFGEGQGNALVVAAHGLANLTLRTLALDPSFDVGDVKGAGVKASDFVPRSEAKGAWVSLTAGTCDVFVSAAGSYSREMQTLAGELRALCADPAVAALIHLRNVHYHRWRGESPGVTGVDLLGSTVRERLEQGQAVGLTVQLLPQYTEGQQALDELTRTTRCALDSIVGRLPQLRSVWHRAFAGAF